MKYKISPTNVGNLAGIKKRKRVINSKECQEDLKDILPELFKAYHKALKMFNDEVATAPVEYRTNSYEANVFNTRLQQSLGERYGSDLKRGKYGRRFLYENGYIILLKKLNSKGMPMNIKTKLSSQINNQVEGNLFNTEEDGTSPIIFFGYTKTKLGEMRNPRIVYIDDGIVKWVITENIIVPKEQEIPNITPQKPISGVTIKKDAKSKKKKTI